MIESDQERFRLKISLQQAISFAMGWSDLDYDEPSDQLRQLIGLLAIDSLEYSEEWRSATLLRSYLAEKWPELRI